MDYKYFHKKLSFKRFRKCFGAFVNIFLFF